MRTFMTMISKESLSGKTVRSELNISEWGSNERGKQPSAIKGLLKRRFFLTVFSMNTVMNRIQLIEYDPFKCYNANNGIAKKGRV